MLQAGLAQNIVAVHRNTIQPLLRHFRRSGNNKNRQRSGRSHVLSHQQDNHTSLVHLWDRFQTWSLTARSIPGLRPISSRTVRNRLRGRHIRPQRPAIRPIVLPMHRADRLTWCRHHLRFRRQDWANILFTDESRFHLRQQWLPIPSLPPRRWTLCRPLRYSRQCYGVEKHNRTWQDTISCCRRKSDRNTQSGWNCSTLSYSVHLSSGQQRHI